MNIYELNYLTIFIRLLLAAVLAGIIGIERASHQHPAGLRTHMVISIGAALAIMINEFIFRNIYPGADPSRMGSQVISGIGFLGVGTIIVTQSNKVRGLTTAAGLWASAIVGVASGIGFYEGAVITGVSLFLTISFVNKFSDGAFSKTKTINLYIGVDSMSHLNGVLDGLKDKEFGVVDIEVTKIKHESTVELAVVMRINKKADHISVIKEVAELTGVNMVQQTSLI